MIKAIPSAGDIEAQEIIEICKDSRVMAITYKECRAKMDRTARLDIIDQWNLRQLLKAAERASSDLHHRLARLEEYSEDYCLPEDMSDWPCRPILHEG